MARVLAAVLALAAAVPSGAQAAAARAVLARGTLAVRGIPCFPPNSIEALYGEYRWGDSTVRVWIVQAELFVSGDWADYALRSQTGAALKAYSRPAGSEAPGSTVFLIRQDGFWLLVEMPTAVTAPRPFLSVLLSRLTFFASQLRTPSDLSLPAILETR